eukprot:TRINITY_DN3475_c0_g1_i1.p1 TRINITY_DN3475_c0_g1~~TRINITY_DN3475_c0_g1_i1.p1  ORF type:complete len:632 (-),score=193.93 TRINITY_DN3475_c0_g1_i1:1960-3705(-)
MKLTAAVTHIVWFPGASAKDWKKANKGELAGVPILAPGWIAECLDKKKLVPVDAHRIVDQKGTLASPAATTDSKVLAPPPSSETLDESEVRPGGSFRGSDSFATVNIDDDEIFDGDEVESAVVGGGELKLAGGEDVEKHVIEKHEAKEKGKAEAAFEGKGKDKGGEKEEETEKKDGRKSKGEEKEKEKKKDKIEIKKAEKNRAIMDKRKEEKVIEKGRARARGRERDVDYDMEEEEKKGKDKKDNKEDKKKEDKKKEEKETGEKGSPVNEGKKDGTKKKETKYKKEKEEPKEASSSRKRKSTSVKDEDGSKTPKNKKQRTSSSKSESKGASDSSTKKTKSEDEKGDAKAKRGASTPLGKESKKPKVDSAEKGKDKKHDKEGHKRRSSSKKSDNLLPTFFATITGATPKKREHELQALVIELEGEWSPEAEDYTTHVICDANKRTLKVLSGIAQGSWVVKSDWLKACVAKGALVNPQEYEVDLWPGVKESRLKHKDKTHKGLFSGMKFFVCPGTKASESQLKRLLSAAGGELVEDVKAADVAIKGKEPVKGAKEAVTEEWVFDSLCNYKKLGYKHHHHDGSE